MGQKKSSFKKIIKGLDQVTYDQILMVGDFNGTINNTLDQQGKKIINQ